MKTKHLSALMRDDITTIRVVFDADVRARQGAMGIKNYIYLVLKEDAANLQPNDMVVTPATEQRPTSVASILEVHDTPQIDFDAEYDYKFIVQKVDVERYTKIAAHAAEMQKVLVAAEAQVKREGVVERYKAAIAGSPVLSAKLEDLLKGPLALPAPAAIPSPAKRAGLRKHPVKK